ncbi:MAG: beta-ketoacyl synthase N-terminal-like domain-containing protein [Planctomycetaceae bacterium]
MVLTFGRSESADPGERFRPSERDVLITGVGIVSPLGLNTDSTWRGILDHRSAGRILTSADIDFCSQLRDLLRREPGGAPVDHAAIHSALNERLSRSQPGKQVLQQFGFDEINRLTLLCLLNAFDDANLSLRMVRGPRTGCVIGSSKASLRAMEREVCGLKSLSPGPAENWTNAFLPDSSLRAVQALLQAEGPGLSPVAACATGVISAILGASLIHSGACDVCIAGCADASLRASVLASFHRLGVLSSQPEPAQACRPFDKSRDGFIPGEGAGLLVLESRKHLESRRGNSYCRIICGGWETDCTGLTQVDVGGHAVRSLVSNCLNQVRGSDIRIDFASLHGTGTRSNDQAEAEGLKAAVSGRMIECFGIKGATGHLLGAAGSVELAVMAKSLSSGVLPGTVNHCQTADDCPISVTAAPRSVSGLAGGLKLSLGFGGHLAACVLHRES